MEERQIDYLLGLLDDAERAAFESLAAADADLSAELQRLQRAMSWLMQHQEDGFDPPPDLVERTWQRLIVYVRSERET